VLGSESRGPTFHDGLPRRLRSANWHSRLCERRSPACGRLARPWHLERLDVAGFPLGALADSQYELGSVLLDVGDTLVVFTDGVIKAENRWREQFGEERVLSVLRTGQTSANETLNRLKARMLSFCGSVRQPDDLSFIVLRRSA